MKFRNLRQKHDGEPDTIEICKCSEDAHYSALQYLQIIERKWFNRFHSRDHQLCKFMGKKEKVTSEKSSNPKELTWSTNLGLFYRYYRYQFLSNINLVPTHSMASGFNCTVGSGYEIEIRIIFGHF